MEYVFQVQILYFVVVALALSETQQSYCYPNIIKSLLLFFENNSLHLFIYFIIIFYFFVYAMDELIK